MLVIVGLALVFAILRVLSGLPQPPVDSAFYTTRVVLVGVTGRTTPDTTDRRVIDARPTDVQIGAMSIRPQQPSECAAAGWLTIGAGRRTTAGGLCRPQVVGSGSSARVADWQRRQAIARAHSGDAQLGTLGALSPGCVEAVGPGAALAAADPAGRLDRYRTPAELITGGEKLTCPLTIIDAGEDSDKIISDLARRQDVTLLVSGIGPAAGSADRNLQVIYRIGTTLPGVMTSDSTRRDGIVILTDLTRTLIGFALGDKPLPAGAPVDGMPVQVRTDQTPSSLALTAQLRTVRNLSAVAPVGYAAGTVLGVILAGLLAISLARRWWRPAWVTMAALGTFTAALMLTGSVRWAAASHPAVGLVVTLCVWVAGLTAGTLLLSRWLRIPVAIIAAGLTMAIFTTDAALGGVMQPGSLLNSRPVVGGRWYGFGNVTFGCYAASVLVVAGYLGHRYLRRGHRWAAVIAVLAVGGFAVICEGWPSMGSDFGGVITLTPAVLLMAIGISGRRVTWARAIMIVTVAVVAAAAVSLLDWARGPGHRSHLGDFVQRVISGDAWPILIRKAIASAQTLVAPLGIVAIIVGAAIWWVIFRRLRQAITEDLWSTYSVTAGAALLTGVLGTLVNDGGVAVFLTVTGPFAATTAGLLLHRLQAYGWPAVLNGAQYADRPTPIRDAGAVRRHPERSGNPAVRAAATRTRTRRRR